MICLTIYQSLTKIIPLQHTFLLIGVGTLLRRFVKNWGSIIWFHIFQQWISACQDHPGRCRWYLCVSGTTTGRQQGFSTTILRQDQSPGRTKSRRADRQLSCLLWRRGNSRLDFIIKPSQQRQIHWTKNNVKHNQKGNYNGECFICYFH